MSVSEPGKIITPWAESGLKNPIPPTANPATGRAGFDQGFSAINMTAKEAGGIPPFGQDFNGIFYEVTNILRYMQAGGQPTFDAALATAIGGYPIGAVLIGDDGVSVFKNAVAGNETNPNTGGYGWVRTDLQIMELYRRSYAEAGYNLVDGSFEEGGILTSASDVLLHKTTAEAYAWSGEFPKVVNAESTPATSGGIGAGGWVDRTDASLRNDLLNGSGSLIGLKLSKIGSALRNLNDYIGDSLPTPEMFGAVGDGTTDCATIIQSIINLCGGVKLSYGKIYRLAIPLEVTSNTVIISDVGRLSGFYTGALSAFKPDTVAIQSSDFDEQKIGFTLRNVGFIGGTTHVDLGLFHEVEVTGCEFFNASNANLVIVRGEKHLISRNRFDASTVNTVVAMSLGRWQNSVNSANYSDAYFGVDGSWFDRATIQNNVIQAGLNTTYSYGLCANILSGSVISDLVVHGSGGGETSVMYVRDRIQTSVIQVCTIDSFGASGSPVAKMFDFGQVLNCTFIDVSPQFAGNNHYTTGFSFGLVSNTVFIGCGASGDNVSKFGFKFPNSIGATCTMINCYGAFYHAATSAIFRNQIAQINCNFSGANNGNASGVANILDNDMTPLLMADVNGSNASTAKWGAMFAGGSGSSTVPFYSKVGGAYLANGKRFYLVNAFGESNAQSILVSNVLPEGNVTAIAGSLCIYYSGTSAGTLYVKQTGAGNTGWVAK